MSSKKLKVLFVRHGETEGNKTTNFQCPETPLNDNGLRQAELCGKRIATEFDIATLVTSHYARAFQTALAIKRSNVSKVRHFLVEELLCERDFGELRGKSYDEMIDRGIEVFSTKIDYKLKDGESMLEFSARCKETFKIILRYIEDHLQFNSEVKDICFVSHGLTMRETMKNFSTLASPNSRKISKDELQFMNTSISVIDVFLNDQSKVIEIQFSDEVFNNTRHVDEDLQSSNSLLRPRVHL